MGPKKRPPNRRSRRAGRRSQAQRLIDEYLEGAINPERTPSSDPLATITWKDPMDPDDPVIVAEYTAPPEPIAPRRGIPRVISNRRFVGRVRVAPPLVTVSSTNGLRVNHGSSFPLSVWLVSGACTVDRYYGSADGTKLCERCYGGQPPHIREEFTFFRCHYTRLGDRGPFGRCHRCAAPLTNERDTDECPSCDGGVATLARHMRDTGDSPYLDAGPTILLYA